MKRSWHKKTIYSHSILVSNVSYRLIFVKSQEFSPAVLLSVSTVSVQNGFLYISFIIRWKGKLTWRTTYSHSMFVSNCSYGLIVVISEEFGPADRRYSVRPECFSLYILYYQMWRESDIKIHLQPFNIGLKLLVWTNCCKLWKDWSYSRTVRRRYVRPECFSLYILYY